MTYRVAVVGTEGTGKTVLMTVWAKAFLREKRGISLIPQTRDTALFLTKNWEYLSKGFWPPSTREGSLLQLRWELRIPDTGSCNVEFREISGQDFRRLFGDAQVDQVQSLDKQLRDIVANLASAEIFILLVNLADFAGEADIDTREKSQWAIKYSLDWVFSSGSAKHCMLLFTQADLYTKLKEETGGWKEVARKYLPYVYTSHVITGNVDVKAVSAVGNTRVVFADDGTPTRVPDSQWHCRGLFSMTEWIGHGVAKLAARGQTASEQNATPKMSAQPIAAQPRPASSSSTPPMANQQTETHTKATKQAAAASQRTTAAATPVPDAPQAVPAQPVHAPVAPVALQPSDKIPSGDLQAPSSQPDNLFQRALYNWKNAISEMPLQQSLQLLLAVTIFSVLSIGGMLLLVAMMKS